MVAILVTAVSAMTTILLDLTGLLKHDMIPKVSVIVSVWLNAGKELSHYTSMRLNT